MSTRAFRITVRGSFGDLSPDQRAALLADAAQHDLLHAAFTPAGHLSYDIAARPFFTFRFLDSGEAADDVLAATERAEAAAQAWLADHGYPYKSLKSQAEDLSEASLSKRQRRDSARKGASGAGTAAAPGRTRHTHLLDSVADLPHLLAPRAPTV